MSVTQRVSVSDKIICNLFLSISRLLTLWFAIPNINHGSHQQFIYFLGPSWLLEVHLGPLKKVSQVTVEKQTVKVKIGVGDKCSQMLIKSLIWISDQKIWC